MVLAAKKSESEDTLLNFRMSTAIVDRIDRVVEAIKASPGARASRRTVIQDVLAGECTLEELEKKYGVSKRR